jgi:glycine dehydrogenase subunit 2
LLIEPTESQAKEDLDLFIGALRHLAAKARSGTATEAFKAAPLYAPRRRLDETLAARKPVLRWKPTNNPPEVDPLKQAAE